MACRLTRKLPETSPNRDKNIDEHAFDVAHVAHKEECQPPSPTLTEADVFSSVLKKLGVLEEKVDVLHSKPSEMPYEKEELLNAAVCLVDALEAELIATKKLALHDALMRQEELLAYIDRQQEAKNQKKKFCWWTL